MMRTPLLPSLLLLPLLLAGCDGLKKFDPPDLPKVDLKNLPLPRSEDGLPLLFEAAGARLVLDLNSRDALTALGACTDWVTNCYAPPERSLDACVEAAPVCATQRPWEEQAPCCPKDCTARYAKARSSGRSETDAFEQVFFLEGDCFPGLKTALEAR